MSRKKILATLLSGGNFYRLEENKFRLRDSAGSPVINFRWSVFNKIKEVCKKKRAIWVISLKAVRSLHGKSLAKQLYKKMQAEKKKFCSPAKMEILKFNQ